VVELFNHLTEAQKTRKRLSCIQHK